MHLYLFLSQFFSSILYLKISKLHCEMMHKLPFIYFVSCWYLTSSVFFNVYLVETGFGVRISFQADGEILTYMAYQKTSNQNVNKRIITKDQFIKYASGNWPNPFNRLRTNLFEKYSIPCGCFKDSLFKTESLNCDALDSLWKIRFSSYPFQGFSDEGWSQNFYRPSDKQLAFLRDRYKIKNLDSDFFIDTNLWQLLKDVQDEEWILNYRSIW